MAVAPGFQASYSSLSGGASGGWEGATFQQQWATALNVRLFLPNIPAAATCTCAHGPTSEPPTRNWVTLQFLQELTSCVRERHEGVRLPRGRARPLSG